MRPRSGQTAGGGGAGGAGSAAGAADDELCQRVSEPKESTAISERIHSSMGKERGREEEG